MKRTTGTGSTLRLVPLIGPLLLGLAIAGGLAWQANAAARAHRAAVERAVRDHADFAAFLLLRVARESLALRALYGFAPVLRSRPSDTTLPPADVIGADPAEARRCLRSDSTAGRLYARYRVSTGELTTGGSQPTDATRTWLADTLPVFARSDSAGVRHAFRADGTAPALIAYLVVRDTAGRAIAVYAANGCFATGDTTDVFADALRSTRALPPSLTAGLPNDSLLSVRVRDPSGRVAWASPGVEAGTVKGLAGPDPALGNATLEVTLRPRAVDRLVAGGLPPSRLPQSLALLTAAAVLAVVAAVQVHRQLSLARMRERFMRNASHELRTPLQQIRLYADLLRLDHLEGDRERRHALEVIDTETHRLIQLVDGVLRFTRGEPAPERQADIAAVPLATMVAETVEAFRPLAAARDARIAVEISDAPTATVAPDTVRQVLLNLLDNAVKFGPAGSTVRVILDGNAGRARLAVEDEGAGIPEADRRRVFEPFVRLERHERGDTPGTGVGLSVVRDLVRRDGGTVTVESTDHGGARFVVVWPAGGRA